MGIFKVGDLTKMAQDIEAIIETKFGIRPGMAVVFTLPPSKDGHWVTNLSRDDGILLFKTVADKMIGQTN